MREAFDVGKPRLKLRQDFENSIGFVFGAEAFGDLAGVFVGASYEADWGRG